MIIYQELNFEHMFQDFHQQICFNLHEANYTWNWELAIQLYPFDKNWVEFPLEDSPPPNYVLVTLVVSALAQVFHCREKSQRIIHSYNVKLPNDWVY
jgi:hypothetical protein